MPNKNLGIYLTLAMLGGGGGLLVGLYIAGRLAEEEYLLEEMVSPIGEEVSELRTVLKREKYVTGDAGPEGKIRYDQAGDDKPNIEDVVIGSTRTEPIRVVDEDAYSSEQPKWDYVEMKYLERDDVVVIIDDGEEVYLDEYEHLIGNDALVSFGLIEDDDPNLVYVINDTNETVYRIERTKRALSDLYAEAKDAKKITEAEAEDAFYDEAELADGGINGRE